MVAVVDIQALRDKLNLHLASFSYDYVIGTAYGYNLTNPFFGYMLLEALDNLKYLTNKEIQNIVKLINSFINDFK